MKTKIAMITCVVVALVAATAFVLYPRETNFPVHRESYLLDMSDTFKIKPEVTDINHSYHDTRKQEREVRLRTVTDIDQGDVYVFELPAFHVLGQPETWKLNTNEIFRDDEIERFEKKMWTTIDTLYQQNIGYDHTSLLIPLVEELIHLQSYPSDTRNVLVYSDLGENRQQLSFLNPTTIRTLRENDASLWESIPGTSKLKDLSGITVYFIHRPLSGDEADYYRLKAEYLKQQIESLGGTVIIQGKIIRS